MPPGAFAGEAMDSRLGVRVSGGGGGLCWERKWHSDASRAPKPVFGTRHLAQSHAGYSLEELKVSLLALAP